MWRTLDPKQITIVFNGKLKELFNTTLQFIHSC